MPPFIPIDVVHLLPLLDKKLLELLKELRPKEWLAQTIAKKWKVKDVVAHLLDGNIRVLSMLRDGYFSNDHDPKTDDELIHYLNQLNADWVGAMDRVSPEMLILLHETTGPLYNAYYTSLDPLEEAVFPVAWAGEIKSQNWMHIAREYTEKFLHQQQIRDALNKPGLIVPEFFQPFAETCMRALPPAFHNVKAADGTTIKFMISGEAGGTWFLIHSGNQWVLENIKDRKVQSEVSIAPDDFWKLVSKSRRYEEMKGKIRIDGNQELAIRALSMVSFMV